MSIPLPLAYSYIRFSTPEQLKGDSLRRQTEAATSWCKRHKVRLDTSTTLHDLGKSAYTGGHRKNPDRHTLAAFLKLVEDGKVPRGSFLIIENLDRLSREHIQPALLLALGLLQAGIRIVQLKPSELIFDDKSDTLPVMMMMMELSRGHGESAIKSERIKSAWEQKRRAARENGRVITHRLPAWIEERDEELLLIPKRAAAVKRIYSLSAAGYGHLAIVQRLLKEKIAAFGVSGKWCRSYVAQLLNDRRVLGEFQPRLRDRSPEGEPLLNYYPAAVTESEFLAARAGQLQRKLKRGRIGEYINVFAGLLWNARDGESYFCTTSFGRDGNQWRVLKSTAAHSGRGRTWSFPFVSFESAILKSLKEVDPREILDSGDQPDEAMVLAGRLTTVESRIAELEAELLQGDVASLARALRQLESRRKELAEQLVAAQQKAANPLSSSWGEARSLMDLLESAPDPTDTRLRLRSVLRRVIDSIWLLVANRGADRLCSAQIWFQGGKKMRHCLLRHQPPKGNGSTQKPGWVWLESRQYPADNPRGIDLRKQEDVEYELERLLAWDPEKGDCQRFVLKGRLQ